MEHLAIFLFVLPSIITSISVSPNGNSPQVKMVGGMAVDIQKGFVPMTSAVETTTISNYEKSRKTNDNATNLSLNERYRRLIPYMTFYYANDLAKPTTDISTNIEVEKAEIVEANNLEINQRQPKKIVYAPYRQIPRYQGNRLTQYNIASANPTKIFYKNGVPVYEGPSHITPYKNPIIPDPGDYEPRRYVQKQIPKNPAVSFVPPTRKPYLNLYNEELPNIRYYLQQKEVVPKYKLVPYEQTPPVKVQHQNENVYEPRKPVIVSVLVPKELYVKPRPVRPPFIYENGNQQPRKQPSIISENYYEKRRPHVVTIEPSIESGFKPIAPPHEYTTSLPIYKTTVAEAPISNYDIENISPPQPFVESTPIQPEVGAKPEYFQYVVDKPQAKPSKQTVSNNVSLASLLNSLQVNKSIPKPITRDNVGSSIQKLLEVLNALKAVQQTKAVEPAFSTPKPFVPSKFVPEPEILVTSKPVLNNAELHEDYLAEVNPPSQHLDDHPSLKGTSQRFPLQVSSDDEGGTPGRPGVDYPMLATIPHTSFDCKTQRYKGFFADTETRCQVWHYCDLNGGQASFLCPNGTIFSQAGLTCDWWFNVQCASTTQLYVLNESLYKYILPHSPKFPEDYSGPLVDKYLTLKFKEMEEEFKKNKNKNKGAEDKIDEEASKESNENSSGEVDKRQLNDLSESSVIIESPGYSGKVERLIDD